MTNNVCADEVLRSVASDLGLSSLIRRLSVLMLRIILLKVLKICKICHSFDSNCCVDSHDCQANQLNGDIMLSLSRFNIISRELIHLKLFCHFCVL